MKDLTKREIIDMNNEIFEHMEKLKGYKIILLWRLNIDVFTCLNFHLPRWSTLCYGPCLTDVHWTSSTINRYSTRYNSFFRLADENLFCVKFVDI